MKFLIFSGIITLTVLAACKKEPDEIPVVDEWSIQSEIVDGDTNSFHYDSKGRLLEITHPDGRPLYKYFWGDHSVKVSVYYRPPYYADTSYDWNVVLDNNGNVLSAVRADGMDSLIYTYDGSGYLAEVNNRGIIQHITWENGNITHVDPYDCGDSMTAVFDLARPLPGCNGIFVVRDLGIWSLFGLKYGKNCKNLYIGLDSRQERHVNLNYTTFKSYYPKTYIENNRKGIYDSTMNKEIVYNQSGV